MKKILFNNQILRERRRELRKQQTSAEGILWAAIRNRKLNKLKFYRQYSIGPYILDFYCPALRLAIELDGKHHQRSDAKIYDAERTQYVASINIQELRFDNIEVVNNTQKVLAKIAACSALVCNKI